MVRVFGGTRTYSTIPVYSGDSKRARAMNPYGWPPVLRTVLPNTNVSAGHHVVLQRALNQYGPPGCAYRQPTVESNDERSTYCPGSTNCEAGLEGRPCDVTVEKDEAGCNSTSHVISCKGEGRNKQIYLTTPNSEHVQVNQNEVSNGGQDETDRTKNTPGCDNTDDMDEQSHPEQEPFDVAKSRRKARRREGNRMSAQAYRTRKRDRMSAHELSVTELEAKNKDLLNAVSHLELERTTFLTMIRARLNINLFTEQDDQAPDAHVDRPYSKEEQPPHAHVDIPHSKEEQPPCAHVGRPHSNEDMDEGDMCVVLDLSVPHNFREGPSSYSTCQDESPSTTTTTHHISWHHPADDIDIHCDVTDTYNDAIDAHNDVTDTRNDVTVIHNDVTNMHNDVTDIHNVIIDIHNDVTDTDTAHNMHKRPPFNTLTHIS